MVWDPTFDWTDATSFNGEARKYDILAEMIVQLNTKATCVSVANLTAAIKGNPLGILAEFNAKFDTLVTLFYDHIAGDGSKWTLAKLETEIGASKPTATDGYLFSPTLINWMYQAIVLLIYTTYTSEVSVTFPSLVSYACDWYWNGSAWVVDEGCPAGACTNRQTAIPVYPGTYLSKNFGGTYLLDTPFESIDLSVWPNADYYGTGTIRTFARGGYASSFNYLYFDYGWSYPSYSTGLIDTQYNRYRLSNASLADLPAVLPTYTTGRLCLPFSSPPSSVTMSLVTEFGGECV